jgi:putative flippase GtrA
MSFINNLLSKFLDKTFFKFVIVGVLNTIFGTSIMFIFYNIFHFNYWISSTANYLFGSILSYFLNKYYTFSYKKRSWKIVAKFTINILICYLLAYGIAKPLVSLMLSYASKSIKENIAMFVGMCLFVALNYLGQRYYAFKK